MASAGLRQCMRDVTAYLIFLIFISTLGPLQFGFHLSELNAPQDVLSCVVKSVADHVASQPDSSLPQCIPMSEAQFALISSMYVLGGFIGALFSGPISTSYGRRFAMQATSIFFILGSSLETLAGNIPVMSFGRCLSGIGGGAATVIVPLYISEVAPPNERGLFGAMTQVTINVGILLTQTLGYYLSKGREWRIILAVGTGLGLFQFFGLFLVPESPAWLAAHKNPKQAVKTLQRIRGHGNSIAEEIEDWDVPKTLTEEEEASLLSEPSDPETPTLRDSSRSRASTRSIEHIGFFAIIRDPHYRPAIIAVVGVMFAQQFCGINSVMMYSVSLLRGVVPDTMPSTLLTILISCVNLITTIACAPLADKIGRKACLLLSISGMGSMALVLAISLRLAIKPLSAFSVLAFVGFFATGLGPVPFMIASELVGQEAVGATQSWALAGNYVGTFIVAQFFPILNTWLNEKFGGRGLVYFGFTALAALSFVFVSFFVPETKGKKDADEVWGRNQRERVD